VSGIALASLTGKLLENAGSLNFRLISSSIEKTYEEKIPQRFDISPKSNSLPGKKKILSLKG